VSAKGKQTLNAFLPTLAAGGNKIVDLRARLGQEVLNPVLTLDLDQRPFWAAADEMARQAQLKLTPLADPETGEPMLGLQAVETPRTAPLPISYAGPFRVAVKQVGAQRNLEDALLSQLTVLLDLAWEPRYRPLLLRMPRDGIQATGKNGQLERYEQAGTGAIKLVREASVEIPLRLPLPPRTVLTLQELRGELTVLVPPEMLTFKFARLAASETVERQEVRATLERFAIDPGNRLWTISLALQYPSARLDLESHQTWAMENNLATLVHRTTGQRLPTRLNPEIGIEEGRAIRIRYRFRNVPGAPEDWQFEYRAPAAPVAFPVPFTFRDVPLP
jgi:hypothetical protein